MGLETKVPRRPIETRNDYTKLPLPPLTTCRPIYSDQTIQNPNTVIYIMQLMAETKTKPSFGRDDSSAAAAETVGNIEELLSQILTSLPARSLARFKCISKHWLHVISDLKTSNKISAFFSISIPDDTFKYIDLGINPEISSGWNPFKKINDSLEQGIMLKVIQACNGFVLCLGCYSRGNRIVNHNDVAYVVNPTTNQYLALSSPSIEGKKKISFIRYGLAFDPSISPYYKVVCVADIGDTNHEGYHKVDIYSSETRTWYKHLEVPHFPNPSGRYNMLIHDFNSRSNECAVYCNGAIHWRKNPCIAENITSGELKRDKCDVLHYFDIAQERMLIAATPPPVPTFRQRLPTHYGTLWGYWRQYFAYRYFGECGGRLYMIDIYEFCQMKFDVMEMERDYSGWSVKYNVDLIPIVSELLGMKLNLIAVLCLYHEKENDDEAYNSSSATHVYVGAYAW